MPENSLQNATAWTLEHDAYCYKHHIPPAAKTLWIWLIGQGYQASEIEPDLSEFNAFVAKSRGKGYGHSYLKKILAVLQTHGVVKIVKKFSWKIFRLLVIPLQWLNPPKKKVGKKLQNSISSSGLDPSNDTSSVRGDMQQQHSRISENLDTLAENNIHYNADEKEVLDRPKNEIKLALILFGLRGGFEKAENPEGWIRDCLRGRYWEEPRNYNRLLQMFGNSIEWDELFPSG